MSKHPPCLCSSAFISCKKRSLIPVVFKLNVFTDLTWVWFKETGLTHVTKQTIIWAVACGCTVTEQQEASGEMQNYSSLRSPSTCLLFFSPHRCLKGLQLFWMRYEHLAEGNRWAITLIVNDKTTEWEQLFFLLPELPHSAGMVLFHCSLANMIVKV